MGRSVMLNEPSVLVRALTSRLVATARALTLAPCTTAPLASVMAPFMLPSVCCASADAQAKFRKAVRQKMRKKFNGEKVTEVAGRIMAHPPLFWNRHL